MPNKRPTDCEWCGRFIILVQSPESADWRPFEAQRDEEDRLLQAYDGTLIHGLEHRCKARCSTCGSLVIVEDGKIFDRRVVEEDQNSSTSLLRAVHRCNN